MREILVSEDDTEPRVNLHLLLCQECCLRALYFNCQIGITMACFTDMHILRLSNRRESDLQTDFRLNNTVTVMIGASTLSLRHIYHCKVCFFCKTMVFEIERYPNSLNRNVCASNNISRFQSRIPHYCTALFEGNFRPMYTTEISMSKKYDWKYLNTSSTQSRILAHWNKQNHHITTPLSKSEAMYRNHPINRLKFRTCPTICHGTHGIFLLRL